ncbi:nicotinate phosphoribosyltransferase [Acanthamoeba castellanii str. Neff]|uniref:nicotinate phosphoribosyltransferase n=1 Tax=Acanthamoeba castellanii (strain ATCC 30010 / Neff) TaxID=1257118 RepID=L8HGS5_ACACF|nr:nicotinate phosphoribosyltransferase [Acanthamoeba castellanii str. Neff]ELR24759.1 nicotinate phosphoribosyltransferase [Acanthamoeba castellanii str. Neff]
METDWTDATEAKLVGTPTTSRKRRATEQQQPEDNGQGGTSGSGSSTGGSLEGQQPPPPERQVPPAAEEAEAAAAAPSAKRVRRELRRRNTLEYIPLNEQRRQLAAASLEGADSTEQFRPLDGFVTPLLTDFYQLTMAYAYWRNNTHEQPAVFDLFFRKNPFHGEFTIYAGLEEVVRFVSSFRLKAGQLEQLRGLMPDCDPAFFEWLATVDCSRIKVYSLPEGTVCFPRIPMIRVEGPMAIAQMLETTLLTLVNFPSLVATNAARHRLAAGPGKAPMERSRLRATPTSEAATAPATCSPASSSASPSRDLPDATLRHKTTGETEDLLKLALRCREELGFADTNTGELTAFTAYARAFPNGYLALVDTYDTLKSGVPNFLAVALALHRLGYRAVGVRLDSGDLAYLSKQTRKMFRSAGKRVGLDYFGQFSITASNDINEDTLVSLNQQGHEIDVFGIGTNLVTCQAQPALGCVYKLVEIHGMPRIKLSQEVSKVTLPGRKEAFRLYGNQGSPVADILVPSHCEAPQEGKRLLCRHPFDEKRRAYVTPTKVMPLLKLVWDQGKLVTDFPTMESLKAYVTGQLQEMRPDHLRLLNPTPYKVSVSSELYSFIHDLWLQEAPIPDISSSNDVNEDAA